MAIKSPLRKPKSKSYYQNKADKYLQELGKKVHGDGGCEICGGVYNCLHHWVYKSESTGLRYDWLNLVPICLSCHFKIHNTKGDMTAGKVVASRGSKWLYELEVKKKELAGQKFGLLWYKEKYEELKNALDLMK